MTRVFVTGYLGYVGNPLTELLLKEGYDVTGCDIQYFPEDGFAKLETFANSNKVKHVRKDVREITEKDLEGHDAVLHLAGLSNDPMGEINPMLTHNINNLSSVDLAQKAKKAGVKRFVFSSSCSVYGANDEKPVDESSATAPLTAYAKSKIDAEVPILNLTDTNFAPTILRSATAYGVSPSMRLDLVVNNLTAAAYATGKVKSLSDGSPWRPLVHVYDMANAFVTAFKSPVDKVKKEIFNVGSNSDNYTVRDIAYTIQKIVPNSTVEFAKDVGKDPRSYRVNFDKIRNRIGFTPKRQLKESVEELYDALDRMSFTSYDFDDKKYYRVKYLKWLIQEGRLDIDLRLKS